MRRAPPKILFGSLLLTLALVALSGAFLHRSLQGWVATRTTDELRHTSDLIAFTLERDPSLATPEHLEAMRLRLEETTEARIRITQGEAMPLALDEALPTAQTQWEGDWIRGWVQVSARPQDIVTWERKLWLMVVIAMMVGLGIAISVGAAAARVTSKALQRLTSHAREMTSTPKREKREETWALSMARLTDDLEQSVDALARERDRFSAVLESMEEAVVALDADQTIQLINGTAQEFFAPQFRLLEGDVIGQRVTSILAMPGLLDLLEMGARGERGQRELDVAGPPLRRVMARITPRGEGEGSVLVFHDVTELRRLETVRRDFIANVSHELRTPVSVIMLNAETLMGDDTLLATSPEAGRFLDGLYRNAERLARLISDLLDISRLEAGRFGLDREPVSVFGAVLRVLDVLEERALEKEQSLETDIDIDLLVDADPKALDQILFNLIENAIKYAPQNGSVIVRASKREDELVPGAEDVVRIEVLDDGPGLSAEHRSRIFERFYRVDDGRSRDVGGTGLGLAIVKHLASAMGGRTGVMPNTPKGSNFWVRLAQAHGSEASDEKERPSSPTT